MTTTEGNVGKVGLHVPEPPARPGTAVDFGHISIAPAGAAGCPPIDADPAEIRELAYGLVRVLDDEGRAVGDWAPALDADALRRALRSMLLTRAFDDRMFRAQRQGKTSFYMKSRGEEAVACAAAMALEPNDMCFTTYRQQGLLLGRGYPMAAMMNQIYSNAADPLKGHQLPILYSARDYGFFTLSGNVGTQYCQAVGWAMANAYWGNGQIAAAWIGDGSTATADFHHALTFATVYRAPVVLNVVNNQWAISSFSGIAGGQAATFAARALGYGLPGLRVDGNDFLAVYAATRWAAERARRGLGATLVELVTYRAEGHSTSDDPTKYRPADEASGWPLGDPIDRLKQHLIGLQEWDEARHVALVAELTTLVREAGKEADAIGTLGKSKPDVAVMFDDVFATPDWRLEVQRRLVEGSPCQP